MSTGDRRFETRTGHRIESLDVPVTRYDVVLGLIPAAFVLGVFVAGLLDVSTRTALVAAALLGLVGVVDALFLNPPTAGGER